MTLQRWQEIERLYHEARARAPSERGAFLDRACADDESLRAELDSLLACRDEAPDFLEVPGDAADAAVAGHGEATTTATSGVGRQAFFRRQPWWVWCWSLPLIVAAGAMYVTVFAAPQPAGWRLKPVRDDGRAIGYRVITVVNGTAAERAGFEAHDLLSIDDVERFASEQQAGRSYRFEVVRAGTRVTRTLRLGHKDWPYWRGNQGLRQLAVTAISVAHLVLAGVLLFARPRDRAARWAALLFAEIGLSVMSGVSASRFAPETASVVRSLPLPLGALMLLAWSLSTTMPAAAFGFCAVFPKPLPFTNQRWWPWWLFLVALLATTSLSLDFQWLPVYVGPQAPDVPRFALIGGMALGVLFLAWALALFVRSFRRIESPNERRRLRLVAAGFAVSLSTLAVDIFLMIGWASVGPVRGASSWQFARVSLLSTAALCTTYAILRHRVFDIHVIVRLGLRYAAARGVVLSLIPVAAMVLVLDVLVHRSQPVSEIASERGLFYVALGVAALALHVKRKAWIDGLDRRFFRERYDAYRLLAGVADDVRRAASFDEAARHVIVRVDAALHPESVSLMVSGHNDTVYRSVASIGGDPVPPISAGAKLVALARVLNKPLENSQSGTRWLRQQLPRAEVALLQRARVEWLFPVSLREIGTQAFLLLGPKRSEEPYSHEDRELLEAVTANLGLLLERPELPGFTECSTCGGCYDLAATRCPNDGEPLVRLPYPRTLAGRYRFDRRLGRGGMGVVYGAFDTELKRQVAVKVIRPDLMASPDAIARFRREARTAARLSHPSVVSVHDFGVADDHRAYLVMELLKGQSLRDELRARGDLGPARTLKILRGVASAVALAHQHGLIHRDLKPENIFLARLDGGEVAKILDFGLVKPLTPGQTDTVAGTLPGALIGTLAYMSPEQQRCEVPAESWDIWALAVVAFEMLTGTHPFALSDDPRGAFGGHHEPARRVEAPSLSASARGFFERAFAVDPSRRPASVGQFIEELEAAL